MRRYIKRAILGYFNLLFPFIELRRSQSRPKVSGELLKIDFFLSFDLDYSRDIKHLPLLLAKLKQYQVKASFACIGKFFLKLAMVPVWLTPFIEFTEEFKRVSVG